jgi:hypothetical protein
MFNYFLKRAERIYSNDVWWERVCTWIVRNIYAERYNQLIVLRKLNSQLSSLSTSYKLRQRQYDSLYAAYMATVLNDPTARVVTLERERLDDVEPNEYLTMSDEEFLALNPGQTTH